MTVLSGPNAYPKHNPRPTTLTNPISISLGLTLTIYLTF